LGDIAVADNHGDRRIHGVVPADKKPGIHRDENDACSISKKDEKVKKAETAWKKNNISGWSAQGVLLSIRHPISRMP
jgi:hypothetical protein